MLHLWEIFSSITLGMKYISVFVQEEMSDLRALIRLKEKELRCLEWSLMGQRPQGAAGVFIPESLREEAEQQVLQPSKPFFKRANNGKSR